MNSKVFNDWITGENMEMRRQGRHILLMLDNASSHGKEKKPQLSHDKVKFLLRTPPATCSRSIKASSMLSRRRLLTSMISKLETASSVKELTKEISLLDAIKWIISAWYW
ncbi:hypothetical protein DPMN_054557 [Dreissena polymorpha]|uniref:DDE-1 domain-containing protein n=1 Tax=Dreissena polymorpha TaxID=45954 RepID=A0A9D4CNC5_DREPO|nr:hypothetical protein DPMN_054557 [Dreissena polymorpha]